MVARGIVSKNLVMNKTLNMKKFIILYFILSTNLTFAQISIGKNQVDGGGILDFDEDNKGIILPIADIETTNTYTNGTILVDKNDYKIKVFQDNDWLELSDTGSFDVQKDDNNNDISTAVKINTSDDIGQGVIIGAENSDADGVLVLESTNKALILPKVFRPHENILSPVAGTICYDTESDSLAVFNGKVWNYWK